MCSWSANYSNAKISTKSDPGFEPGWITTLVQIWIQMSAGSLPKCCGFINLSATVTPLSFVKIEWRLYEKC